MRLFCVAVLLCTLVANSCSKKVLIIGAPMITHMNELNIVGTELAKMGHKVYQVRI